ncbi:hypothetical protein HYT60_00640 [Candidatus Woesebacteria bacterium]|nr:hypothetical protein [Candidatus Woesebacteria bacterium]
MSEYLKRFGLELIKSYGWQEILESGEPIDRKTLSEFLIRANEFLTTEPGPHLAQRREYSTDWLKWWIEYIKVAGTDRRPALLLPINRIRRSVDPGNPSGVLFAGGLEGHRGHRWAVDRMLSFVKPILLFEQDEYLAGKERQASFLPLEVRLSMWSHYRPDLMISVLPQRNPAVTESEHYKALFEATGADYCFATDGDQFAEQKMARGKPASFTLIPYINTEPTTFRVQKLF